MLDAVKDYLDQQDALSHLNANIQADKSHLIRMNMLLENNPRGRNPQEVAEAIFANMPGIFYHTSHALKGLYALGELTPAYYPKREWLMSLDGKCPVATEVPWSLTPLVNGGVWPTREEAIEEAHRMKAEWEAAQLSAANEALSSSLSSNLSSFPLSSDPLSSSVLSAYTIVPTFVNPCAFVGAL